MLGRAAVAARVSKASKDADDLEKMSARKFIYRLMTIAPAIFMGGLAVHARAMFDGWEFIENDTSVEAKIQAYRPLVHQAEMTLHETPSATELQKLASSWTESYANGKVVDLEPISYEDTSSDGVKSQIFSARSAVGNALLQDARHQIETRHLKVAVEDIRAAIRIANTGKYSDFVSIYNSSTEQRRAIYLLKNIFPKLSPSDRANMLDFLHANTTFDQKRAQKLALIQKHNYLAWRSRQDYPNLSIIDTKTLAEIPVLLKGDVAVAAATFRERAFASRDRTVPQFTSSVRLGIVSQLSLEKLVKELDQSV